MKKAFVAKLPGCWRRRGPAHPPNQLRVENRFRRWESAFGSTSLPSHADPDPGIGGLEMGPPPVQAHSHQLSHPARPRPVLGSSFLPLPLPLRGKLRVQGDKCPRSSEPLINIAISREETVHPAVVTGPVSRPGRRREHNAGSLSLCTRGSPAARAAAPARSRLGSGKAIPAPGVWETRQTACPASAG